MSPAKCKIAERRGGAAVNAAESADGSDATDSPRRIDPDVDLRLPADRRELAAGRWPVLAAISAGGLLGAVTRALLQQALPTRPGAFPWATFGVNVTGCLLIGVLMVLVTRRWPDRRLVRPFAGVGVLGGFTTFSTYAVEVQQAVAADAAPVAVGYLLGTVLGALLAVAGGTALAERLAPERLRRRGADR